MRALADAWRDLDIIERSRLLNLSPALHAAVVGLVEIHERHRRLIDRHANRAG